MKAVILVGGEGTRLRPLTYRTPKCMVPVLNTPFLERVIRHLRAHDVTTVVLALGHLSPQVEEYFGDGSRLDVRLVYSVEDSPLGTAGPVKLAEKHLDATFVVLNGDVFTDLDITAMLALHRERKAKATIALTPVEDPTAYGLIETDASGRVTRFLEKPGRDQVTTNMINAGTYILEPDTLKYIPAGAPCSFEREFFPTLLSQGEPVYSYPSGAYWIDIGTPRSYLQLNIDLLGDRQGAGSPRASVKVQVGEASSIHPAAQVSGAVVIGERCSIARGVKLIGPAVVGPGSSIGEDAIIIGSVIWSDVVIGSRATVENSVVAGNCRLGDRSTVSGSVLGDGVTLSAGAVLRSGSRVGPGVTVS